MVKEWNLLRVVACLSIVLLHSTTQTGRALGYVPQSELYEFFRIVLCYATPTFIILSEIILANRYKEKIPQGFFAKRLKFIVIPYLIFAVIDSLVARRFNPHFDLNKGMVEKIFENIFPGDFVGWFVLIIIQFYLLHYLVIRFNIPMKILVPISFITMFIHLYLINHHPYFIENELYLKLPFTAWFGYFTLAYVAGRHYEKIAVLLKKYKWYTLIAVLLSLFLIFLSYRSGNVIIYSRRMDLFPLVISISLAILAWGQLVPNVKVINLISNYAFAIYLLHWQLQVILGPYVAPLFESTPTQVFTLFVLSLSLAITLIKLISLIPYSEFVVGNVKRRNYENKDNSFIVEEKNRGVGV